MSPPVRIPFRDLLLVARLWVIAALVRLFKYTIPLPRLVAAAATTIVRRPSRHRIERLRALADAHPGVRLPGNCLERSLGLFHLLIAAGATPQLAVGVKRGTNRLVDCHVWVLLDGTPLGETESSLAPFERLMDFDARGRSLAPPIASPRIAS
jgi:hypothetical protein